MDAIFLSKSLNCVGTWPAGCLFFISERELHHNEPGCYFMVGDSLVNPRPGGIMVGSRRAAFLRERMADFP